METSHRYWILRQLALLVDQSGFVMGAWNHLLVAGCVQNGLEIVAPIGCIVLLAVILRVGVGAIPFPVEPGFGTVLERDDLVVKAEQHSFPVLFGEHEIQGVKAPPEGKDETFAVVKQPVSDLTCFS